MIEYRFVTMDLHRHQTSEVDEYMRQWTDAGWTLHSYDTVGYTAEQKFDLVVSFVWSRFTDDDDLQDPDLG